MDNIQKSNKNLFLYLYEFFGTAILTASQNLNPVSLPFLVVCLTILSQDLSYSHFNPGLTLSELLFNFKKKEDLIKPAILVVTSQLFGSLFGILITYLASNIVVIDFFKVYTPTVVPLCPSLLDSNNGCSENYYLTRNILTMEFTRSFVFYLAFLIIRNSPSLKNQFKPLVQPILIGISYYAVLALGPMYNGYQNPILAFQTLIWSAAAYNSNLQNQTFFDTYKMGRYAWIYILVPFIASICAALWARFQISQTEKQGPQNGASVQHILYNE